jgi:hypothetical protein
MSDCHVCPACGYPELTLPPRTESGGSYEICRSCGFEFGVTDDDLEYSYTEWRQSWIARGMPWSSRYQQAPAGWDAQSQLTAVLDP